jgi:CheY-like chemotaxis protein
LQRCANIRLFSARRAARPLVLIVEDNAINMRVCDTMLHKIGVDTRQAWNGLEAIVCHAQAHASTALVLCNAAPRFYRVRYSGSGHDC